MHCAWVWVASCVIACGVAVCGEDAPTKYLESVAQVEKQFEQDGKRIEAATALTEIETKAKAAIDGKNLDDVLARIEEARGKLRGPEKPKTTASANDPTPEPLWVDPSMIFRLLRTRAEEVAKAQNVAARDIAFGKFNDGLHALSGRPMRYSFEIKRIDRSSGKGGHAVTFTSKPVGGYFAIGESPDTITVDDVRNDPPVKATGYIVFQVSMDAAKAAALKEGGRLTGAGILRSVNEERDDHLARDGKQQRKSGLWMICIIDPKE